MSKNKISLCMIVGNVEEYIDICLTSFSPIADEIIVVRAIGNQKPDKTCDIARDKFGAKVFEYKNAKGHESWPHVDSFAAARQMSFDKATGEFCFWCDSDDVLKSGVEIVRELADNGEHDVYIFPYEIFGRGVTVPRERMIRRTAKGRWLYPVHECFAFDETTNGGTDDRVVVEHLPKPSKTGSNERNLRILEGVDESEMTPGLWFHLHQELRAVGRIDDSIKAATKAITHPDVGRPEKYELLLNLATMTQDRNVAHSYLTAAYAVNPQRREALGLMACCAIDAGKTDDALALARQMMATERPSDWSWNDRGAAYGWLGIDIYQQCLRASGNYNEAETVRRAALKNAGGAKISLLHATRGRPHEASKARKMWMDLAEHPENIEHIFAIDEDDDESFALRRFHHAMIPGGGGCVAAWNAAAILATGEILVQLSDDWIPTAKWDTLIRERMDVSKPQVLAISDGHRTDKLLCMFICTRKYYCQDFYLFHPSFTGVFSDNWATDVAYSRGQVIEARDLVFTHDHPAFNHKKRIDGTYAIQNHPDRYTEGRAIYERLGTGADWSSVPGFFNYRMYYDIICDRLKDGDVIAEIGVWLGRSICYMAQRLKAQGKKVKILAVDTFQGEKNQPAHSDIVSKHGGNFRAAFEANLERCGVRDMVEIIEGDSARSAALVATGSLAFAYIDAAHDYESVRRDIRAWAPKIKTGGAIGGHDAQHEEVTRAVKELLPAAEVMVPVWHHDMRSQWLGIPKFSILTPAIWKRYEEAERLQGTIAQQNDGSVEHLVIFDNRKRSVGLKRQACLDIARGEYIAFVDDDDDITGDYIARIIEAIDATGADVITFDQRAFVNGMETRVNFDLANKDEAPNYGGITKRSAWHVNVWKRELVKDCLFPDSSYGEDFQWALQARARVKTHHHIDAILHEYHHSEATTAAPMPL